jgi:hypothetical protein
VNLREKRGARDPDSSLDALSRLILKRRIFFRNIEETLEYKTKATMIKFEDHRRKPKMADWAAHDTSHMMQPKHVFFFSTAPLTPLHS